MNDEIHRGIAVFVRQTEAGSYGFIEPDDSNGSREQNVWFGEKAVQTRLPFEGEPVEYVLHGTPHPRFKTRNAASVWPKGDRR